MMNKPVAWMLTLPDGTHDWILDGNGCEGYIPLYTHPVKENYMDEILNNTLNMERNHNEKAYKELYDFCVKQQAEIEALTTQFVRVADENNRLKDKIEMLTKGKVEYGYYTTKTS